MKVWIAAIALLLLLALILRERYENYADALKDVGQTAGYVTPKCDSGYTLNSDESSCEKTKEDGTKETKTPSCPSGSSFTTHGTRGVCEPSATEEAPAAETSGATTSSTPAPVESASGPCPSGYTLTPDRGKEYCMKTTEATCPSGYTLEQRGCTKPGSEKVNPTCTEGRYNDFKLKCVDVKPVSTPSTSTSSPSGPAGNTATSSAASVSTGGSSGNLFGPNSGGVGKTGKNVWGPIFTGLGESSSQGGDSTKTNKYPGLLGGMMGKESSRIDGVGITSPSQPGFGLDMGALPSLSSLGTEANARFLPFSRPETDAGLTADPYRLAKSYSTKNYSAQPDPVPFLTDFSAFFK